MLIFEMALIAMLQFKLFIALFAAVDLREETDCNIITSKVREIMEETVLKLVTPYLILITVTIHH